VWSGLIPWSNSRLRKFARWHTGDGVADRVWRCISRWVNTISLLAKANGSISFRSSLIAVQFTARWCRMYYVLHKLRHSGSCSFCIFFLTQFAEPPSTIGLNCSQVYHWRNWAYKDCFAALLDMLLSCGCCRQMVPRKNFCLYSFKKFIIAVHAIFHYRTITSAFSKQDSKVASYNNTCPKSLQHPVFPGNACLKAGPGKTGEQWRMWKEQWGS